ncbi:MAG: HAMP domain-containing histidine kinase [Tannerellaceae bacterium]|nr:HAMP domain-containing histidine kinase [Tannerellaceae bacterium]
MKAGNKIAWFYTGMTVGVVAMVTILFYAVASGYINRLYFSYLTEKAYATAEKQWEKDEVDDESYARIEQRYEETLPVATEILLDADSLPGTHNTLQEYLTPVEIKDLYDGRTVHFRYKEQMGAAIYYPDNEGNFIVLVLSGNQYGLDIRKHIGLLSFFTLLVSSLLIYLVSKLYASRMVDRIDAAYKSERSFISNASHELNNPLTAIQGECEISLMKERTPAEYQAALKRIDSETKRIIQLIKHLLFLSRGDKSIHENSTRTIMLADFLMQFVDKRVSFSPDSFGFAIEANPHLLKIAIGNLLNNALKYSGDQPVEMRLRSYELEIEDKGIGIPAEDIPRISQPFYRAANTREYPGHGIGLSLSYRILENYGAKLEISSEPGKGTLVRIIFS